MEDNELQEEDIIEQYVPMEEFNEEMPAEFVSVDDFEHEDKFEMEDEHTWEKQVFEKKNDKVVFPDYASFINLDNTNSLVERMEKRFEENYLLKLIGLPLVDSSNLSKFEKKKMNYAISAINDSNFVLLSDQFHQIVEGLKGKIILQLRDEYDSAMNKNYEYDAEQNLSDSFAKILEDGQEELQNSISEIDIDIEEKISTLHEKQKKELEEMKQRHNEEIKGLERELNNKKEVKVGIIKSNIEEKLSLQKEELLDNEMYNLKYQSVNKLVDIKKQGETFFETEVDAAIDNIWPRYENEVAKIKAGIKENLDSWKKEVDIEDRKEYEEREENRKQQALQIEKEKLELEKIKMNSTKNAHGDESQSNNNIDMILSKLEEISSNNIPRNNSFMYAYPSQPPVMFPPSNENGIEQGNLSNGNNPKINKKNNKKLFAAGGLSLFLFFAGGIVVQNISSPSVEPVEAKESVQYEEIASSISQLENLIVNTEDEEEILDLEILLLNQEYDLALSHYTDRDSLEQIENEMFENHDIKNLRIFNETYQSKYGKLDQFLLEDNKDAVLKAYKGLSKNDKKDLSKSEKREDTLNEYLKEDTENEE